MNKQPKDPNVLMQSIHPDAAGNLISEGDIIEFTQFDKPYVAEVYWEESCCGLRIRTKDGLKGFLPVDNPRIIATMAENPEKLTESGPKPDDKLDVPVEDQPHGEDDASQPGSPVAA